MSADFVCLDYLKNPTQINRVGFFLLFVFLEILAAFFVSCHLLVLYYHTA